MKPPVTLREYRDAQHYLTLPPGYVWPDLRIAPSAAPENWSPPVDPKHPVQPFADDGGYQYKQRMYADAAAGDGRLLVQSCKANGIR